MALIVSCSSDKTNETKAVEIDYNGKTPKVSFTETTLDFGQMTAGEVVEGNYSFTNKGDAPLIVTHVKAACGCTATRYTKEPIMPGKTGSITALFDSNGFSGTVYKSISVFTNAQNEPITLYLVAELK